MLKEDPIKIIPFEFKYDNYTVLSYEVPKDFKKPEDIKVIVKFSYGGTLTKRYLSILKDYLNS